MADALIRNLKLLNAKERDHLMRFAYLGEDADYASASTFLSAHCNSLLREHALDMGLSASARCVFAGMDYHLDWLFAALWTAKTSTAWMPQGEHPAPVPMAPHEGVEGVDPLYTDFRPVTGSQEDVDLLVVYDDGEKLAMLFIEAKGIAEFNEVQLARKLIRLDRILDASGVKAAEERSVEFRLILASPKRPRFSCCFTEMMERFEGDTGKPDRLAMRNALEIHRGGIGMGMHYLRLSGFPQGTYAVKRMRDKGAGGAAPATATSPYTHWELKVRA
ncbi:hypothetical protein [Luteimonas sp. MC1572]|nr:hypothetical protein [Luteimonas sp. MC1572]